MALTPEQKSEVDRLVSQRIDEFKAQQSKRNTALKALRSGGKILEGTEEQLFSLLEREGLLGEENGKYMIIGKDKYGFRQTEEIAKALPNLLKDKFAHYSVDNTGSSQNAQPDKVGELSAQQLYEKLQKDGNGSLTKAYEEARQLYS